MEKRLLWIQASAILQLQQNKTVERLTHVTIVYLSLGVVTQYGLGMNLRILKYLVENTKGIYQDEDATKQKVFHINGTQAAIPILLSVIDDDREAATRRLLTSLDKENYSPLSYAINGGDNVTIMRSPRSRTTSITINDQSLSILAQGPASGAEVEEERFLALALCDGKDMELRGLIFETLMKRLPISQLREHLGGQTLAFDPLSFVTFLNPVTSDMEMLEECVRKQLRVFEITVDDCRFCPSTEEDIEMALRDLGVQYLDWRPSIASVLRVAIDIKTMHLYTCPRRSPIEVTGLAHFIQKSTEAQIRLSCFQPPKTKVAILDSGVNGTQFPLHGHGWQDRSFFWRDNGKGHQSEASWRSLLIRMAPRWPSSCSWTYSASFISSDNMNYIELPTVIKALECAIECEVDFMNCNFALSRYSDELEKVLYNAEKVESMCPIVGCDEHSKFCKYANEGAGRSMFRGEDVNTSSTYPGMPIKTADVQGSCHHGHSHRVASLILACYRMVQDRLERSQARRAW
ncbi:hypothetical protein B0I35DRAFT_415203 [Stachybotrys elegans]|uniref:Peptidase S8/S53 domain-containing protein n=1 Tax=Stachybotrys elegans TaxID=80388 RepID=A0A8K0SH23_9HYPO|nr:hypothetical protein B0I35DRAFT_415203 [Stachybotrys elegans]